MKINNEIKEVKSFFNSEELEELIGKIQNRGGEIIKKQNLSSGLSAANSIGNHLRDLFSYNSNNDHSNDNNIFDMNNNDLSTFSCGTLSDNNPYNIPNGLIFSFPCYLKDNEITILPNLHINSYLTEKLNLSVAELLAEKTDAESFLNNLPSSKL